jgi:microcin C transport system substrate-binding protein
MRLVLAALLAACSLPAWAAHGYALWGDLKYPAGFSHFDYVNADAPKGGEIRLVGNSRAPPSTSTTPSPFAATRPPTSAS